MVSKQLHITPQLSLADAFIEPERLKNIAAYFTGMTNEKRQHYKLVYEKLIAIEKGHAKGIKTPWMYQAYKTGLQVLTEVMEKKNEL